MGRRKRIRKIEKWARNNPPLLPVEREALSKARVTICEAVTWLATGKACSGKVLGQMPLSDDIPEDVQTRQKIELAGGHLWDAFGENDLPIFGYRANDYGEPSAGIEQIPSEKFLSRRTTTAPPMGLVDDTISVGGTTYEGVTMRRSDLLLFIKKGVEQPDTTTDGVKVPTDWYEQVKVWFVEKYVPAHANDSPHPNRNDSYAAACERSNKGMKRILAALLLLTLAAPAWGQDFEKDMQAYWRDA